MIKNERVRFVSDEQPVSIGVCFQCQEPMWMLIGTYETYRRNNHTFYCTHGHQQHFLKGKSETDKLREQIEDERRRASHGDCLMYWQAHAPGTYLPPQPIYGYQLASTGKYHIHSSHQTARREAEQFGDDVLAVLYHGRDVEISAKIMAALGLGM